MSKVEILKIREVIIGAKRAEKCSNPERNGKDS